MAEILHISRYFSKNQYSCIVREIRVFCTLVQKVSSEDILRELRVSSFVSFP